MKRKMMVERFCLWVIIDRFVMMIMIPDEFIRPTESNESWMGWWGEVEGRETKKNSTLS